MRLHFHAHRARRQESGRVALELFKQRCSKKFPVVLEALSTLDPALAAELRGQERVMCRKENWSMLSKWVSARAGTGVHGTVGRGEAVQAGRVGRSSSVAQ